MGTKIDLEDVRETDDASEWAENKDIIHVFTSAKNKRNVDSLFRLAGVLSDISVEINY